MSSNRAELLDNEWHLVRDSGELPEVAYNASLYYLTQDENGPHLQLTDAERGRLLEAAQRRYRDIILRDMLPENRGKSLYRGLKRSMENWQRFKVFQARNAVESLFLRQEAASTLLSFLASEVGNGSPEGAGFNCTLPELLSFAHDLGLIRHQLPENIGAYCLQGEGRGG
ncbi:MAG: hypothetical protein P4L42_07280 [Desulfocapsaceae bacterium]|nr:hypothetical protein [Desulfocapsaceae bacterium]